jgi:hypothetical protein
MASVSGTLATRTRIIVIARQGEKHLISFSLLEFLDHALALIFQNCAEAIGFDACALREQFLSVDAGCFTTGGKVGE